MKIKEIFKNDISRELEPVVNVGKTDKLTVETEINEYVFTQEVTDHLCRLLTAIKDRPYKNNGIWIKGYFGSGKSHFIKYLDYCFDNRYKKQALQRLEEAAKENDPTFRSLPFTMADVRNAAQWANDKSQVDSIIFNIGDKIGSGANSISFTEAMWQEFDRFLGFSGNRVVAEYLEKPLRDKGKFEQFVQLMDEEGFTWSQDAEQLAFTELDFTLEIAKEVEPSLSYDVIRKKILDNDFDPSVENFVKSLNNYLSTKDDNYRLIFFIDEVSQFVGSNSQLLLQLQQLSVNSKDRLWLMCTAQQDISEIVTLIEHKGAKDDFGKITDRFQVINLSGTDTTYITKKRILEKSDKAELTLGDIYSERKDAINTQYQLPANYSGYESEQDFIDFYPFVPYQLELIIRVLDGFLDRGFLDEAIRGNERSVLRITHNTARDMQNEEIGKFVSFDKFYNSMIRSRMTHTGQQAIRNARAVIDNYPSDKEFLRRVVGLIFMVSNIKPNEKSNFPVTHDNLTTLLLTEVDQNRHELKKKITDGIKYLIDANIVKVETNNEDKEIYSLFSDDESQMANMIRGIVPDDKNKGDQLSRIYNRYLGLSNKTTYSESNYSIGLEMMGNHTLTPQNKSDIEVNFVFESGIQDPEQFAFDAVHTKLYFFMADSYMNDEHLRNRFYNYCQVEEFIKTPQGSGTVAETFRHRAQHDYDKYIRKGFEELFDKSTVIIEGSIVDLANKKGKDKYQAALQSFLKKKYKYAEYVTLKSFPRNATELKTRILNSCGNLPDELYDAEQKMEEYFSWRGNMQLKDVTDDFKKAPYGWNEYSTLYVVVMLVERGLRSLTYRNNYADRKTIAEHLVKDKDLFTVGKGNVISQETINEFINAWKDIFSQVNVNMPSDPNSLFEECKEGPRSILTTTKSSYKEYSGKLRRAGASTLADILDTALEKIVEWTQIRDPRRFFSEFTDNRAEHRQMIIKCNEVIKFCQDQLERFKEIKEFVDTEEANFIFLQDNAAEMAEDLKNITTDKWPIDRMPRYTRLRRNVTGALSQVREQLKEDIRKAYDICYENLESIVYNESSYGFKLPDKADIIESKQLAANLHALKLNADTEEFFKKQIENYNDFKKSQDTPKNLQSGEPKSDTTVQIYEVKTKTLRSKMDVEDYLRQLRSELMSYIDRGNDVVVK